MTIVPPTTPVVPALRPFPWDNVPYTNVAPLTIRDNATMQWETERIKEWIRDWLIPHTDNEFAKLVQAWLDSANALYTTVNELLSEQAESVNDALDEQRTAVNTALAAQLADVTAQLTAQNAAITSQLAAQDAEVSTAVTNLTAYVDEQVQLIINDAIQVQDPVLTGILSNPESASRIALDQAYATVINAKNPVYGIAGDGVTDDTVALNALFAALTPRSVIVFPRGEYVHSGVSIIGKSSFAIVGEGAVFTSTSHTNRYLSFEECSKFTVTGVESKGRFVELRQGPTRAFSLQACTEFSVENCIAGPCEGVGIYVGKNAANVRSTDGRLSNNTILDTKADGLHITGGSKRINVNGNVSRNTGDDAYAVVSYQSDGEMCELVSIVGNTSYQSHSRAIAVVGGKSITVSGNAVDGSHNSGVYVAFESSYSTYGCEGITISGNTLINVEAEATTQLAAIQVTSSNTAWPVKNVTIVGNTIVAPGWHGILIGSGGVGVYNVLVANNNISETGTIGILVQQATDVTLNNNMVRNAKTDGIVLNGTQGVISVLGNTVIDANRDNPGGTRRGIGVICPALIRGTVAGNTVYDSTAASTIDLDFSTSINVLAWGNNVGGNWLGYATTTAPPMIIPGNVLLAGALPSNGQGGGVGVIGIRNANTIPGTNPGSGVILYAEGGALKVRGSSGTVTTIAPA